MKVFMSSSFEFALEMDDKFAVALFHPCDCFPARALVGRGLRRSIQASLTP